MSDLRSLTRRLERMETKLDPPRRETRLPCLVVDPTGTDLPRYEQHNCEHRQIAQRLRCAPKVYIELDLDEDGSEL